MNNTKPTIGKLTTTAVLTALSLTAFILESYLPSIYLPGAKIGLANIFTLLCLVIVGLPETLLLVIARTVLGCLIVGNPFAITFSLTAGLASAAAMAVLVKFVYPRVSLLSVSVLGAVVHNAVQTLVFCALTATPEYLAYLGALGIVGVISGAVTGLAAVIIIRYVPLGASLRNQKQ